ncbi:MAG TPA: PDZ domain-containing protein [Paludibacter sp.]|nr:PDZ domain-containing protein [Paludibacter sp.]
MKRVLLFALSLLLFADLHAANKPKPITSIPFEMVGSYVVIRVRINDSSPLNLILDSGIRNTIITELLEGDQISLNYSDVKDLMGLGGGMHLEAYSSNYNSLKIVKLKMEPKTVFVLKEDIFNLSKHTGTKINGLIGVDIFHDYIVEVNYSNKRVNFYNRNTFFTPKGYEMLPLSIEAQKMFVTLSVFEADSVRRNVKMLIDTGAELNAWFQTFKTESVHIPQNHIRGTIGQGLNGEIKGKIGRIPQICFGAHCLQNPIVSFPDSVCIADIVGNSERDGTIGSQILSRFNYIIDYGQKRFYFKPNANFRNKFSYNIAGIEVTQIFPFLPQTEVWKVWEESPAAKAGVLVGDQVLEVNGKKSFELNINEIKNIFQTPSKFPLKIMLFRDNKEISLEIDMDSKI